MRIAVIGAGTAGLTAAWLLSAEHDVTVYESGDRPGGNALSVPVSAGRHSVHVDSGAQHLSPDGFPAHRALRRLLGIGGEDEFSAPMSLTVSGPGAAGPCLVTPDVARDARTGRSPVTGRAWQHMAEFVAAADASTAQGEPSVTAGRLIHTLGIPGHIRDQVLLPWLASFVGCRRADAAEMPARTAAAWALLTPPESPDTAAMWTGLVDGLGAVGSRIAGSLGAGLLLNRPVSTVEPTGAGGSAPLRVVTEDGGDAWYDRAVVAVPAQAAAHLLDGSAPHAVATALLRRIPYVPVTVALHRDPAHMPADRRHWSAVNVACHDGWGETTYWYGPALGLDIFKSWITHRAAPSDILHQADYRQLLLTADAVRARNELRGRQTSPHIQLAGSYLHGIDSQESAVRSAVNAVDRIAPHTARMGALREALAPVAPEGRP